MPQKDDQSAEILRQLAEIRAKLPRDAAAVEINRTAKALQKAKASVADNTLVVPIKSVNDILQAAAQDKVSLIIESLDLDKQVARLVIHGASVQEASDMGRIRTVDELSYVRRPANSRCQ